MTHRGMMIAIPEDEWAVFQKLTPVEMAGVLIDLARNVRLALYPKQPRGPNTALSVTAISIDCLAYVH